MKTLSQKDLDATMNGTGGKAKFDVKKATEAARRNQIDEESDENKDLLNDKDSLHSQMSLMYHGEDEQTTSAKKKKPKLEINMDQIEQYCRP